MTKFKASKNQLVRGVISDGKISTKDDSIEVVVDNKALVLGSQPNRNGIHISS